MSACIDVMKTALMDLAKGQSMQPLRAVTALSEERLFAVMPAYLRNREVTGAKTITIFPENHRQGFPSHQGMVSLFDGRTGAVTAILDAQSITAIRTAAVSGVATDALAKADASRLALIGTGEQARTHLEAMLDVRPFQTVKVWGPNRDNLVAFRDAMTQRFDVAMEICASARDAVCDADVICTVTASKIPVVMGEWVRPDVHINAVGACRPTERELDTSLVKMSRFYADSMESVMHESGDYLLPLHEGAINEDHVVGSLGDLLLGRIPANEMGRLSPSIFKSLGLAIEDLAAADYIYQTGVRLGRGTNVDLV